MDFIGFDWDTGNKQKNLIKHGITCDEAEEVFFGIKFVFEDQKHSSTQETRYVVLGCTLSGKTLFIAFTLRNRRVRVISARPMSLKERKWYEEAKTKTGQ